MQGRQGKERFLPRCFPTPPLAAASAPPTTACLCLAGTRTLLPTPLSPQPPLASHSPPCCHSIPMGMSGQVGTIPALGRAWGPTTQSLVPAAFVSPSQGVCASPSSTARAWAPQAYKDWFWVPPYTRSQGRRQGTVPVPGSLSSKLPCLRGGNGIACPPAQASQQRALRSLYQSLSTRCRQAGRPAGAACSQGLSPLPAPPGLSDLHR